MDQKKIIEKKEEKRKKSTSYFHVISNAECISDGGDSTKGPAKEKQSKFDRATLHRVIVSIKKKIVLNKKEYT